MKKLDYRIFLFPLLSMLPILWLGMSAYAQNTPADAVVVETMVVQPATLTQGVTAVGSLSSENAVELRPEISGRIAEINFEEGGAVKKGQVLFRLDSAIPQAELERAQAALSLATSHYHRAVELNKQGFISKQARDESASQLKVQQASVSLAKAQLDKTLIVAPFDGLIGLRKVSLGDYVSPGTDLAPLESVHPLNVDFRVPERFLPLAHVGTPITLRFDALPGLEKQGVVGAINPLLDVGGRSIMLRAKVPNQDGKLRPGLFARVELQFANRESVVVPEAAIAPAGEANFVYKVENNTAIRTEVVLGQRRTGNVEIVTGLDAGDEILVSGLQKVSDGTPIKRLSDSASQ